MKKLIFSLSFIFALVLSNSISSSAEAKEADAFTLNEIGQIFVDYIEENNIGLEIGSEEFVEYLLQQQLDGQDEKLAAHPQYELINYYIGEYLYQLDQHQGEDTEVSFTMNNMTIGELKEEIKLRDIADEEFEQKLEEREALKVPQFSIMATYNRTKVADYARQYATKTNPNYKRYNLNCTNFVSQAIHAGGKAEVKPSPVKNGMLETTTYWFNDNYMDCTGSNSCYMRDKTSTSWVRVTDFYSYWTKKGMGATTSTNKNTIISNANVGDVIQFKSKNGWFHSVVVNRKANGTVYISSNTANYYNQDFKNRGNDSLSFRVIKIK